MAVTAMIYGSLVGVTFLPRKAATRYRASLTRDDITTTLAPTGVRW
jgi:hypothetical protein